MMERLDDLTTWLFWKKVLVAFVIGFLPPFLYGLIDLLGQFSSGTSDYHVLGTFLVSLVLGGTTAGLRAVLALFTDWLPTDALHGVGKDKPDQIVVTRSGVVAEEPPDDITVELEPEPVPKSEHEPEPEPKATPKQSTPPTTIAPKPKPSRKESRSRKRKSGS